MTDVCVPGSVPCGQWMRTLLLSPGLDVWVQTPRVDCRSTNGCPLSLAWLRNDKSSRWPLTPLMPDFLSWASGIFSFHFPVFFNWFIIFYMSFSNVWASSSSLMECDGTQDTWIMAVSEGVKDTVSWHVKHNISTSRQFRISTASIVWNWILMPNNKVVKP